MGGRLSGLKQRIVAGDWWLDRVTVGSPWQSLGCKPCSRADVSIFAQRRGAVSLVSSSQPLATTLQLLNS
jgi:hypothetical protein